MRFYPAPSRDRAAARVIDGHTSTDFTDQPPLGHPAVARLFWLFSGGQPDRLEDGGRVKEPGRENADHRAVDKYQCRPSSCGQALAHDSTPKKKVVGAVSPASLLASRFWPQGQACNR